MLAPGGSGLGFLWELVRNAASQAPCRPTEWEPARRPGLGLRLRPERPRTFPRGPTHPSWSPRHLGGATWRASQVTWRLGDGGSVSFCICQLEQRAQPQGRTFPPGPLPPQNGEGALVRFLSRNSVPRQLPQVSARREPRRRWCRVRPSGWVLSLGSSA